MILVVAIACNNKEDEESPKVIISYPLQNKSFSTVDTISIQASITDNAQLTYVEVSVLNSDFTSVGRVTHYPASGTTKSLNVGFALDLPQLESGSYYIAVRASDGKNIGSGYVSIYLHALPLKVERTYIITSSANQFNVYRQDSVQDSFEFLYNALSGLGGAAISPVRDVLLIAGSTVSDAVFFDSKTLEQISSVPNLGDGTYAYFCGAEFTSQGYFYLMSHNGLVQVFDNEGVPLNSFFAVAGYRALKVFEDDNSVFTFETGITTPWKVLAARHKNGTLNWQIPIDGTVQNVSPKSLNEAFFWVSHESGYSLKIFQLNTGVAESVFNSANGAVLYAVYPEGAGQFLLATNTGIYKYTYGQFISVFASDIIAEKLYKNNVDGTFYCVSGSEVRVLNAQGTVIAQWNFSEAVRQVLFDYNR